MCLVAGLLAGEQALAEGLSIDVEMMRPTFSPGMPLGVESPTVLGKGSMRVGYLGQYQRDPVLLYLYDEEAGSVIRNRFTGHLGFAYDVADWVSVRGVLPVALDKGTELLEFSNMDSTEDSNAGLGDIEVGARLAVADAGPLAIGIRGDLLLPIGTNEAYLGEVGVRGRLGAMGLVTWGPARLGLDASALIRNQVETDLDYSDETTIDLNTGAALDLWPGHLAVTGALLARWGSSTLGQPGGENASEWLAGLQLHPGGGNHQLDVGVGKGLSQGVGTSQFRWFLGYTFVRPPEAPPPEPVVVVVEEPEPDPIIPDDPPPEPEPEPEWKEDELARIQKDQIVIRDPIQFEFNTDNILDESMPILGAVASILNNHAEIGHIVIEGHASEEGSFEYNYDLSNLRARSIWKQLMREGVHPDRISYRGMGEVVPVKVGDDEESLAANRRVEFHIVERLGADGVYPVYSESTTLPWSGETVKTVQPKQPEPPPPEEPPKTVEEQLEELLSPDNFSLDELDEGEDDGALDEPREEDAPREEDEADKDPTDGETP